MNITKTIVDAYGFMTCYIDALVDPAIAALPTLHRTLRENVLDACRTDGEIYKAALAAHKTFIDEHLPDKADAYANIVPTKLYPYVNIYIDTSCIENNALVFKLRAIAHLSQWMRDSKHRNVTCPYCRAEMYSTLHSTKREYYFVCPACKATSPSAPSLEAARDRARSAAKTAIFDPTTETHHCPSCDTMIDRHDNFCHECGQRFTHPAPKPRKSYLK